MKSTVVLSLIFYIAGAVISTSFSFDGMSEGLRCGLVMGWLGSTFFFNTLNYLNTGKLL